MISATRLQFPMGSTSINSVARAEFTRLGKSYGDYNTIGPLGSTHNIIPIDKKSSHEMSNGRANRTMSHSRTQSDIRKITEAMNLGSRIRKTVGGVGGFCKLFPYRPKLLVHAKSRICYKWKTTSMLGRSYSGISNLPMGPELD